MAPPVARARPEGQLGVVGAMAHHPTLALVPPVKGMATRSNRRGLPHVGTTGSLAATKAATLYTQDVDKL